MLADFVTTLEIFAFLLAGGIGYGAVMASRALKTHGGKIAKTAFWAWLGS